MRLGEASAARLDYSRSEEGAAKLLIGFGKLLSHCRARSSLCGDRRPGLSAAENISFVMKKGQGCAEWRLGGALTVCEEQLKSSRPQLESTHHHLILPFVF